MPGFQLRERRQFGCVMVDWKSVINLGRKNRINGDICDYLMLEQFENDAFQRDC